MDVSDRPRPRGDPVTASPRRIRAFAGMTAMDCAGVQRPEVLT